jgi:PTS system galactitol-specific IIB component
MILGNKINRPVEILIACGSGIATSSVAAEAIKEVCATASIPIKIHKGQIQDISALEENVDVIMVTMNYRGKVSKPLIKVFGLISGINDEKVKSEIVSVCSEIYNRK